MAEPDYRVQCGATAGRDPVDLEIVKRHTHDGVVDDLGPARTGPILWRIVPAAAGRKLLAHMGWPDPALDRYLRANPGGMLVIAMATYDPALLNDQQRAELAEDHADV